MDIFDFEELVAEMLDITDDEREDDDYLGQQFYDEFEIELECGYELAKRLLNHTTPVKMGLSGEMYHAFVSKKRPVALMKTPYKE